MFEGFFNIAIWALFLQFSSYFWKKWYLSIFFSIHLDRGLLCWEINALLLLIINLLLLFIPLGV